MMNVNDGPSYAGRLKSLPRFDPGRTAEAGLFGAPIVLAGPTAVAASVGQREPFADLERAFACADKVGARLNR